MNRPTKEELATAEAAYRAAYAAAEEARAVAQTARDVLRELIGRDAAVTLAERGIVLGKTTITYLHGYSRKKLVRCVVSGVGAPGNDPSVRLQRLKKDGTLSVMSPEWTFMDQFFRCLESGHYKLAEDYVAPENPE